MDSLLVVLMVIIFLGIFSQWIAWRFRMPAIVVMSIAGLLVGPVLGLINPQASLGEIFNPLISLAVAIILFEGSLNLDFREVRTFSKPLTRVVTLGAFIAWIAGSLAAHFLAGLSLEVAFIIGGLFIVTGPTVILPLLRQAKLKSRPAAILKWEGIVVDPFGALLAVFAYEFIKFAGGTITLEAFLLFFGASIFATLLGIGAGWGQGKMIERGMIPEFLKAPMLFAVVLLVFVASDSVMHETGLLAVTAMGIMMANMHIASINDIRHFKENISVLLISTIFVMLTASLQRETLLAIFDWGIILFVAAMLFIVRPLSIWISTIGTELDWKEKTLIGWIAPRGIVALTVSGYFAGVLTENGYQDADILTALTFALVFSTVVFHGFSIGWLAKKLNLAASDRPGVLIVGGNEFTAKLGESLKNDGVETLIADNSWEHLRFARKLGVPTYRGDILSEQTEYSLDFTPYPVMIAATETDAYNALITSNFVPDIGREMLFQTAPYRADKEDYHPSIGGIVLFDEGADIYTLARRIATGHVIRKTMITEKFTEEDYVATRPEESLILYVKRADETIQFWAPKRKLSLKTGDTVVSLTPPVKEMEKATRKVEQARSEMT
ncbi:cation:proton antiporter [Chryseomicrobium aureum]|uniref:cation:proton antiporter n=1 Tax=Chryseomicrobium aureum TaxID=1441723 RepID=UPI00370D56DF